MKRCYFNDRIIVIKEKEKNMKIYKYKKLFILIGLMLSASTVINTFAYQGIGAYKYFTNQSNLLVLIVFVLIYFNYDKLKQFKIISFITLISMSITGVVFHLLLPDSVGSSDGIISSLFDLNNWHNLLTHTINPIYYVLFYFIFIIDDLKIKDFWLGMIHPIIYFTIILVLSPLTKFYPYPFLDVSQNGLVGVLKTTLLIMLPVITIFIVLITTLKVHLNKKVRKLI